MLAIQKIIFFKLNEMKKFFLFLSIICMVSCLDFKNNFEVKDTMNRFFAALNNHDTILIAKFFTDTSTLESPNWEGVKIGSVGAKEVYGRYFKTSPDLKFMVTRLTIDSRTVVVEYTTTGTMKNLEVGSPSYMQNKTYTIKNITRFETRNGKIYKAVSYFDQVAFLRQMGFFEQY
jgi:steroid delta-isomerase-like uncharacterized protein